MKLYTIDTGFFKLDGGAMFGVVPKVIWNKINPGDENNLCNWAMRCLLVVNGNRKILIDCGMGNKQSEKFFSYYEPNGTDTLENSLKKHGFTPDDITDMFLTHFHFDHCGGAIKYDENKKLVPAFKNATYWSNEKHWNWAVNPNAREKASFLKENILPIKESGQLKFINDGGEVMQGFTAKFVYGHTEAMMLPQISVNGKTLVYMADLVPSAGHLPLPYVMAYDVRPLVTLNEKENFLKEAAANEHILFFEHDPNTEACTIELAEGKIKVKEKMSVGRL
jgi:glyoxylase-like metal-dependent hydrolase (beta-lactamase superfamily II)